MYYCHDFGFKDEESEASRDELTFLRTPFISGITKICEWTLCFDSPDDLIWLTYLPFSVPLYVLGGWPVCVFSLWLWLSCSNDKRSEGGKREAGLCLAPVSCLRGNHRLAASLYWRWCLLSVDLSIQSIYLRSRNYSFPQLPSGLGMVIALHACQPGILHHPLLLGSSLITRCNL